MFEPQKRQIRIQETKEHNENELIQVRLKLAISKSRKELCGKIIDRIMKKLPTFLQKYQPSSDSKTYEEILRRFAMLTQQFVTECVEMSYKICQNLDCSASAAKIVEQTMREMATSVLIIPDSCEITCELVRARMGESIAKAITEIVDERIKWVRNKRKRNGDASTGILNTQKKHNEHNEKSLRFITEESKSKDQIYASQEKGKIVCHKH